MSFGGIPFGLLVTANIVYGGFPPDAGPDSRLRTGVHQFIGASFGVGQLGQLGVGRNEGGVVSQSLSLCRFFPKPEHLVASAGFSVPQLEHCVALVG